MIRDYQAISSTWFEHGKQKIIKTYGKHRGVKLVGCLDYESGDIYCEKHENYDAQTFQMINVVHFARFLQKGINKLTMAYNTVII